MKSKSIQTLLMLLSAAILTQIVYLSGTAQHSDLIVLVRFVLLIPLGIAYVLLLRYLITDLNLH